MNHGKQIRKFLKKKSPKTPLWNNCDNALVGTAQITRDNKLVTVAIYDYDLLVELFYNDYINDAESQDDAQTDAIEWVDYNIIGAYIGIRTPIYSKEDYLIGLDPKKTFLNP